MLNFNTLFGLQLSKKILKITDNLSRTLQNQKISAAEGQAIAELTLKSMRTDTSFTQFFNLVERFRELNGTNLPVLPRKRKTPQRFEVGSAEGYHSATVQDHYRCQYYEVLDTAIESISDRFDQPGYRMYRNLECLLVDAANGKEFGEFFESVTLFYKEDFDRALLSAQLQNLRTCFVHSDKIVSLEECIAFLCDLSVPQKSFFSEVCRLVRLVCLLRMLSASVAFQP